MRFYSTELRRSLYISPLVCPCTVVLMQCYSYSNVCYNPVAISLPSLPLPLSLSSIAPLSLSALFLSYLSFLLPRSLSLPSSSILLSSPSLPLSDRQQCDDVRMPQRTVLRVIVAVVFLHMVITTIVHPLQGKPVLTTGAGTECLCV